MKKLSAITLIFENTEFMTIPVNKVSYWHIHDVTEHLSFFYGPDEVYKYNKCRRFDIRIDKDFLDSDYYIGGYCSPVANGTYRDRLNLSDIVDVELEYIDGSKVSYVVPWPDNCDFENPYQHWDGDSIVICDNDEWKKYKELGEYVDCNVPDVEPKELKEPKNLPDKICDVCGKSENCQSIKLLNYNGTTYKSWNLCDKCAKSVWDGIRSSIIGDILNRHSCVENEATNLRFLIENNMLHLNLLDRDWYEKQLENMFRMDMSEIFRRVYEITGK